MSLWRRVLRILAKLALAAALLTGVVVGLTILTAHQDATAFPARRSGRARGVGSHRCGNWRIGSAFVSARQ
jgi:hypothetical protein